MNGYSVKAELCFRHGVGRKTSIKRYIQKLNEIEEQDDVPEKTKASWDRLTDFKTAETR